MKKFLSLVLALVMTMSLVTVSAGAKDFTDDSKIAYDEAVDVMSAVKVVDGYANGSFNPQATLTRGAAAKIICNLILGPTTASALTANQAPYKDVAANHTFAGYIAFCKQQKIISGYADGTFRPAATLTSYAFMKMLLGALGYDAEVEHYVGSNWSIQVAKRALQIDLDDGLKTNFVGTKPVTREEACLYAFNTLQANMVDYDTTIQVGNITVAGSKAEVVSNKNRVETIYDDDVMQFAEKYFSDLKLTAGSDDFARPSNVWKVKAEEIGTYPKSADATYTKKVEAGDIYTDLSLGKTLNKADVTVYEDGVELKKAALDIKKGSEAKVGNTDNGVLTEVYYDSKADTMDIITINFYAGEVNKTVKETSKRDAYIVIDTENVKPANVGGSLEFETNETFEDDAFVVFSYSQSAKEVKTVALAENVNGTVSRAVNEVDDEDKNVSVTIGGTKYDGSKNIAGDSVGEVSVNNDYNVYLDSYGYMIYIEEDEVLSGDYALLLNAQDKGDFSSNRALLVFGDGTERVVDTAKNYKSGDNAIPYGTIVTYKADDKSVYTLKPVSKTYTSDSNGDMDNFTENYADLRLTNDKAGITVGNLYTITRNGNKAWERSSTSAPATLTSNSKTMFVVYDKEADEYSVYNGIKNAPTITPNAGDVEISYYCKSGNMGTIMFIFVEKSADIKDDNNNGLFLAGESVSKLIHDKDGDYFEYNAIVNGELKVVKVDESVANASKLDGFYKNYSVDKYGVITSVSTGADHGYAAWSTGEGKNGVEYLSGSGLKKISADYTVILDTADGGKNETITVADNAKIYYVDKDGKISESSYRSISQDDNDGIYALVDEYLVTDLVIREVPADEKPENNKPGKTEIRYVRVDLAQQKIVLNEADKIESGMAWTAEQKAAFESAAKAALYSEGWMATSSVSYGTANTIKAVERGSAQSTAITFEIVWG